MMLNYNQNKNINILNVLKRMKEILYRDELKRVLCEGLPNGVRIFELRGMW